MLLAPFSFAQRVKVIGLKEKYVAGDKIVFNFSPSNPSYQLHIKSSYGSLLIQQEASSGLFLIPKSFAIKSGIICMKLYRDSGSPVWTGNLEIIPKENENAKLGEIEAYCGPKHLIVGRDDFTMIIGNILDQYDNPYPDTTQIQLNVLIQQNLTNELITTNHLIAYKRVYAPSKSGYGSLSLQYGMLGTKEFRLDYYANDPADFKVFAIKQHQYADGNQLISIYTDQIRDPYNNIIENGTLVYFRIKNSHGAISSATAETINGVAKFELPAPLTATTWSISASVPFYSISSESVKINFQNALHDFDVKISEDRLEIGPFMSFMEQFLKDGIMVEIELLPTNPAMEPRVFYRPIKNGIVHIDWEKDLIPIGAYHATLSVSNLKKHLFLNIKYD